MGRWTQHEEDGHRLPEGLVRTAYDADSGQYTFRDTKSGKLYRSAPGESYGALSPVSDRLDSRPNAFAPSHGHTRSRSAQDPFLTFHDMLPAHAIATSPTKTSPTSRFGFGAPASNRLRSAQSTRIPPSSQATNPLHMRSKSAPNESVRSRNHHGSHSHPRDTQHHSHRQHDTHSHPRDARQSYNQHNQGNITPSHKNAGKSGFSFSSTLQSISRSLTTMCSRTRQANSLGRPGNDAKDSYRHL